MRRMFWSLAVSPLMWQRDEASNTKIENWSHVSAAEVAMEDGFNKSFSCVQAMSTAMISSQEPRST
jgi:hypothetical protein